MKIIVNQLTKVLVLMGLLTFMASCGDDTGNNNSGDNSATNDASTDNEEQLAATNEEVPVVCLWSAVSLRKEPKAKGKYITTLYLGENATFLGEKTEDDSNAKKPVEYIKVRLADGKEGWMASRFMAINGVSHVFTGNSKLYKRPDILASGKDEFDRLQYVVVLEEKDDWVRVKGIDKSVNWFRSGWVKKDKLTDNQVDVTVAILYARALGKKDTEKQVIALQEIVDNSDLASSMFISNVKSKIESLNMPSGDEIVESSDMEDI